MTPTTNRAGPLGPGHFVQVAVQGFGDGRNGYAWSGAWFDDHVYIGTNRETLAVLKKRILSNTPAVVWPVPVPEDDRELDLCGQIWRFSPTARTWQRVYRSPLTKGLGGRTVPVAYGFRNLEVFQGKSDPKPALYTIPACGSYGLGPVLLRSQDGTQFDVISEPGLGLIDSNVTTFRGVIGFKGKLFISPSGSRGQCNTSYQSIILCSDDPARGDWQQSNVDSFGDPTNYGIFDIGVFNGHLYAGTINVREGCQLWKTDAEGPPPHRWTKVFDRGADRGQHNQLIMSFAEFNGALYVGTGVQNGGRDQKNHVGPAAAEVLRVYPDDSWDLVVGEPRLTRAGLKIPASGLGPGFNNPFCGYIWRLRAHDGAIYAGNFDSSSFLPFADVSSWPAWVRRILEPETLDQFLETRGGCELWRSTDGNYWSPMTRNGFNNPYNYGIRALVSTPHGLFAGTANPFGPRVAVRGPAGWRYEDNPRGGVEVWHGARDHVSHVEITSRQASVSLLGYGEDDDWTEQFQDDSERLGAAGSESTAALDELCRRVEDDRPFLTSRHASSAAQRDRRRSEAIDPGVQLARSEKDLVGLEENRDAEIAELFAGGGLRNVGYWRRRTGPPRAASAQLLTELLALRPRPLEGTVLAVGAGDELGTELERRLAAARVEARTGWDDAPPGPFDLVLWIEGPDLEAPSVNLRLAWERLTPGGVLLASTLVGLPLAQAEDRLVATCRRDLANTGLAALRAAGFDEPLAFDVTRSTWLRFQRYCREYFFTKLMLRQIDEDMHREIFTALPGGGLVVEGYLFLSGRRSK